MSNIVFRLPIAVGILRAARIRIYTCAYKSFIYSYHAYTLRILYLRRLIESARLG